mmetsp:Transcript_13778/g.17412  ORF Transcript_13778/g.17412 Transcript_13778/m.17412 type:complete len:209 (-) Transcript_13778:780-1406(-)
MFAPLILWFYLIPALTALIFVHETEWVEKPGTRPPPPLIPTIDEANQAFDPLAEEVVASAVVEEPDIAYAPEMIEVELPITWAEYFLKLVMMGTFMFFGMLISIWIGQEGMLYNPDAPIKYMEQNPYRYQAPTQRDMEYEEIWIQTKDNLKLQGWLLLQREKPETRNTIIFLHENAGNIGLRMDWFEIVYKQLNVNVLAVAYRGFSRS